MISKDRYGLDTRKQKKGNVAPQAITRVGQSTQPHVSEKLTSALSDRQAKIPKASKMDINPKPSKPEGAHRTLPILKPNAEKASGLSTGIGASNPRSIQNNAAPDALKELTRQNQHILEQLECVENDENDNDVNTQSARWSDFPIRETLMKYIGQDTITPKNDERSKGHLRKNSSSNRPNNFFEVPSAQNRRYFARPGTKVKHQAFQTMQVPTRATNRLSQNGESLLLQCSKDELSLSQVTTTNLTSARSNGSVEDSSEMIGRAVQINKQPIQTSNTTSTNAVCFKRAEPKNVGLEEYLDNPTPKALDRKPKAPQANHTKAHAGHIDLQENNHSQPTTLNSNPFTPSENANPSKRLSNLGTVDSQNLRPKQPGSNGTNAHSTESKDGQPNGYSSVGRANNEKQGSKTNSNSNSNSNSYVKTKSSSMNKKHSDHKSESTNISNGDSPLTHLKLDCDEALDTNFLQQSRNDLRDPQQAGLIYNFEADLLSLDPRRYGTSQVLEDNAYAVTKKPMTLEEELKNFNPDSHPCTFDSNTINFLIETESEYAPDPHYFEKRQSKITKSMRTILMDWMMEVCNEFTLKRETYHYSLNYVDRYLSSTTDIERSELQLIGVTAMHIASKVEEIYAPKIADFAKSADNSYTMEQIKQMEMKMLKAFRWMLTPPTLNTWANWYMCQWDLYIESAPSAISHPLVAQLGDALIQFKKPEEKAYARFRECMQLIDTAVLDIETLQYNTRTLVAAFMYLILGKHFGQFSLQQIVEQFPYSSQYLLNPKYSFNDLFGEFLLFSFGFQLIDLLPSIQYASRFFHLPLNFDLPNAARIFKENVLEGHFEEFMAYQTHHPYGAEFIKRRPKDTF